MNLCWSINCLSRGLELGDGLGSLRDSVLGKLSWKKKTDSSLDLTGRKGALLVVTRKTAGLKGKSLKDIVDERV